MTAAWIVAGIIGLVVALGASRRAVHHASALAFGSRLPPFVIGLSLLAIGTDLPEIANSIISSVRDQGDVNVSDSIGSAATLLSLVLGLLPVVGGTLVLGKRRVRLVGGLTILALILGIFLVADGYLSRLDGGVLVIAWMVACAAVWKSSSNTPTTTPWKNSPAISPTPSPNAQEKRQDNPSSAGPTSR